MRSCSGMLSSLLDTSLIRTINKVVVTILGLETILLFLIFCVPKNMINYTINKILYVT